MTRPVVRGVYGVLQSPGTHSVAVCQEKILCYDEEHLFLQQNNQNIIIRSDCQKGRQKFSLLC